MKISSKGLFLCDLSLEICQVKRANKMDESMLESQGKDCIKCGGEITAALFFYFSHR